MAWFSWGGGRFSAIDNYAGGAFCHCRFGLFARLIVFIVEAGEVIFCLEEVGLFFAHLAADATDLAHLPRRFTILPTPAGNGHHIFLPKADHLNQKSRTNLRTGRTAGALFIIDRCQAIDYMQGIELARPCAVAKTQTAEFTGLDIR